MYIQTLTHTKYKIASSEGRSVSPPARTWLFDGGAEAGTAEHRAGQGQHRRRKAQVTLTADTDAEVVNKMFTS